MDIPDDSRPDMMLCFCRRASLLGATEQIQTFCILPSTYKASDIVNQHTVVSKGFPYVDFYEINIPIEEFKKMRLLRNVRV
jgi:hypothetical protein